MGRYTCQAVNMLGVDNRYVDVTVKCEYSSILYCRIIIYLVGFVPSQKKICVSTLTIIFKNEDESIFLIYLLVVYICIEGTDVKCFNCYCNKGGAMIVCTLTDLQNSSESTSDLHHPLNSQLAQNHHYANLCQLCFPLADNTKN